MLWQVPALQKPSTPELSLTPAFRKAKAVLDGLADNNFGPSNYRGESEKHYASVVLQHVEGALVFAAVADAVEAMILHLEKTEEAVPAAGEQRNLAAASSSDPLSTLGAMPLGPRPLPPLGESARLVLRHAAAAVIDLAKRLAQPALDARRLSVLGGTGHRVAPAAVGASLVQSGLRAAHSGFAVRHRLGQDGASTWSFTNPLETRWPTAADAACELGELMSPATSPTTLLRTLPIKGTTEQLPPAFYGNLWVLPSSCGPPLNDDEVAALLGELATRDFLVEPSFGRFAVSGAEGWGNLCSLANGTTPTARSAKKVVGLPAHLENEGFKLLHSPLFGCYLSFGATSEHADGPKWPGASNAHVLRIVLQNVADPEGVWSVTFRLLKGDFSQGCEPLGVSEKLQLSLQRGGYMMAGPASGMAYACPCCTSAAAPCACGKPRRVQHQRVSGGAGVFLQFDVVLPAASAAPREKSIFMARLAASIEAYNRANGVHGARLGFELPAITCGALEGVARWLNKPTLVDSLKAGTDCTCYVNQSSPAEKRARAALRSQHGKDTQNALAAYVGALLAACEEAALLSDSCIAMSLTEHTPVPRVVALLFAASAGELVGSPQPTTVSTAIHPVPAISTAAARECLPRLRVAAAQLAGNDAQRLLLHSAQKATCAGATLTLLLTSGKMFGQQQMNAVPNLIKPPDVRRAERRLSGELATVGQRIGTVPLSVLRDLCAKARKAQDEGNRSAGAG